MVEPSRSRLDALTTIRFVAALHVVLFHLAGEELARGPAWCRHAPITSLYFWDSSGAARHRSTGGVLAYLVVALVASVLVFRLIEQPARRVLRGRSAHPNVHVEARALTY